VHATNGTDIFKAEEMLDHGLWDHSLLEHCGAGSMFSPVGPWATCKCRSLQSACPFYLLTRAFCFALSRRYRDDLFMNELTHRVQQKILMKPTVYDSVVFFNARSKRYVIFSADSLNAYFLAIYSDCWPEFLLKFIVF
jgi:hypothetical protein